MEAINLTIILAEGNQTRQLAYGNYLIGRDAGCSLVINDHTVSRQHAKLDITPTSIRITDLGSKNGTFVNGVTVTDSCEIQPGDLLCFGKVITVFGQRQSDRAEPTAAASHEAVGGDWALVVGRTQSFDSIDVRTLLKERTDILHRLISAFGGLGAIIRYDVRNVEDLNPYLSKLAEIVGAAFILVAEFTEAGDRWRVLAQNREPELDTAANLESRERQMQQAFDNQEIALIQLSCSAPEAPRAVDSTMQLSLAVPLTSDGDRVGVLYFEQLTVHPSALNSRIELALLGADILALKLRNMRQRELELRAAAADGQLRESEANRETLMRAYQLLQDKQEEQSIDLEMVVGSQPQYAKNPPSFGG